MSVLAAIVLFSIVVASGAACDVPTDAQFYNAPAAQPGSFAVTAVTLPLAVDKPQPVNPVVIVSLSDLPDPATVQYPALRLGPRGQTVEFTVEISLVKRQLTLWPKVLLLPDTDYFVRLSQDVRALSGQRLAQPIAVRFHTGSSSQPTPPLAPPIHLSDVMDGITGLRARCALSGCHSSMDSMGGHSAQPAQGLDFASTMDLTPLRRYLTTTPARGSLEGLLLVQPGLPEQSYLLRKLVAGTNFARISGSPMPPAGPPLDPGVLAALEVWIRQGGS